MADKQTTRVLRSLKAVGGTGLTQVDWLGPNTPDGGDPITRLAARIADLKREGHQIDAPKGRKRDGCQVYVLKTEAWVPIEPAPPAPAIAVASDGSALGEELADAIAEDYGWPRAQLFDLSATETVDAIRGEAA